MQRTDKRSKSPVAHPCIHNWRIARAIRLKISTCFVIVDERKPYESRFEALVPKGKKSMVMIVVFVTKATD